jgi:hypothetical protein
VSSHCLLYMCVCAATFVQGPPPEESLTGDDRTGPFKPIKFEYSEQTDSRKRKHRMISGGNDVTSFEAKNFGEGVARNSYQCVSTIPSAIVHVAYTRNCSCRYLLGVYSAKRKRLDLYPAEGGVVFGLQLTKVRAESTGADVSVTASGGLEGMNMRERRDMVIQDFGSRKKQKMERSRKANIVDITAIDAAEDVAKALRDTSKVAAAGAGADSIEGVSTTQSKVDAAIMDARKATLPPFNLDATTPEEAYPMDGFMPDYLIDELSPTITALMKELSEKSSVLEETLRNFSRGDSDYVRDRLARIGSQIQGTEGPTSKERSVWRRRLRCLFYLKWLVSLHNAPAELRYKELIDKSKVEADKAAADVETAGAVEASPDADAAPPRIAIPSLRFIPEAAVSFMLTNFTELRQDARGTEASKGKLYVKTPALVDKLRSYIAVLSLIVEDYSLDIGLLAKDLKLVPGKLADLYKEAGCILASVREGETAEGKPSAKGPVVSYKVRLQVPLNFPKLKLGRRK